MAAVTFTRSDKERKSNTLVYLAEGRVGSVRINKSLFTDKTGPATVTIDSEFAPVRVPRAKETPEERKARMAALPKLTDAEKLAKIEQRAAKLREKLAKAQAA